MNQYEPMREVSREELLAELNKIALRPIGPSWANLGHEANAQAYALHRSTRCSPKVSGIEATQGRVCPKAFGGEVTLEVSSSCCEPNNGKFSIKDGGWKNMDGMPGVKYKEGGNNNDHGDGPEHKEITIDLSKFPYDIADGDWELKWEGSCDQEPGNFDSETTIKQSNNCEECPDFKLDIDDCIEECEKGNKVTLTASTNKNVDDDDVNFLWYQGRAGDEIKLGQGTELTFTCGKDNENKATQKHDFTVVATHSSDTCEFERQATTCAIAVSGENDNDGGDSSSHCTDMEATGGCSPFRFDCTTESARFCVGEKGKVNLYASTHGCDSEKCPGTQLSYIWYESDRKDGGWKVIDAEKGQELVAKPPSNLEAGDKYYYKCKVTCADYPGGSVTIEGGGGKDGKEIITVDIIDCIDGNQPCQGGKQYCNKDKHPDQPEGCHECCKDKNCSDDQICENGKCKDAKCPDPCQKWSESFSTCVQKCNPGEICDPKTGDCQTEWQDECSKDDECSGKKSKCCTKSGKKVCQECCNNQDCPNGKCVNGECVPNGEPDPGPPDPGPSEDECSKDSDCAGQRSRSRILGAARIQGRERSSRGSEVVPIPLIEVEDVYDSGCDDGNPLGHALTVNGPATVTPLGAESCGTKYKCTDANWDVKRYLIEWEKPFDDTAQDLNVSVPENDDNTAGDQEKYQDIELCHTNGIKVVSKAGENLKVEFTFMRTGQEFASGTPEYNERYGNHTFCKAFSVGGSLTICPPPSSLVDGICVKPPTALKCCTNEDGQKVCLECCGNNDCPEGEICKDGTCTADPDYDVCKDVDCPDGLTGAGPAQCVGGDCVCDDENAIIIGGECVCDNGYEWDEENEVCIPNGTSTPPPDIEEDPCFGVTCTPPQECVEGECVCPEGTELINGLCLDPDPCLGVLCPPNAECVDGICTCLPGYVVDEKGNCVMAETPGCEPPEDCCPANSTICVQAGSGLGGGGCFTLNQDCDKTIMLWVDPNHEAVDDDCDEHGLQQICACTKEIQMLTDMITSLTARIAELEQVQGVIDGQAVIDRDIGGGHFQTSQ